MKSPQRTAVLNPFGVKSTSVINDAFIKRALLSLDQNASHADAVCSFDAERNKNSGSCLNVQHNSSRRGSLKFYDN
jgi:hypothetical protein